MLVLRTSCGSITNKTPERVNFFKDGCNVSLFPDDWNLTFFQREIKTVFKGNDRGWARSLKILLLIESGPDAFPVVNEIKIYKMSSFKSNKNIHKKDNGSYYVVSANKASSG